MGKPQHALLLIDSPASLWSDWNRAVRFMEYLRANLRSIITAIPCDCEPYLAAGGTAHNPGLIPLLMLYIPWQSTWRVPDDMQMIDTLSDWCAALSAEEVDRIVETTEAPTWDQLLLNGVHPIREHYRAG